MRLFGYTICILCAQVILKVTFTIQCHCRHPASVLVFFDSFSPYMLASVVRTERRLEARELRHLNGSRVGLAKRRWWRGELRGCL